MSTTKRKSARWMVQLDERILEYIESNGWASPGLLTRETGFPESEGRIRDRCLRLHYSGFLYEIADEMYDLTVEGRLFLDGELNAKHQPVPTASAVHGKWRYPPGWSSGPIRRTLYDRENEDWLRVRYNSEM